jgi:hypothetical protein
MLGRSRYPALQVMQTRQEFADLATGWRMVSAASAPKARAEAEVQIFNQMIVALEGRLAARWRGAEGRVGPALTEVRLLALGITANGGVFPDDETIRWKPDASVTGYRAGDRIALTEEVFSRLAEVVLDGVARTVSV